MRLDHAVGNHQDQLGLTDLQQVVRLFLGQTTNRICDELQWPLAHKRHGLIEFNDKEEHLEERYADGSIACLEEDWGLEPEAETLVDIIFNGLLV
jgi:hypothetical protein